MKNFIELVVEIVHPTRVRIRRKDRYMIDTQDVSRYLFVSRELLICAGRGLLLSSRRRQLSSAITKQRVQFPTAINILISNIADYDSVIDIRVYSDSHNCSGFSVKEALDVTYV